VIGFKIGLSSTVVPKRRYTLRYWYWLGATSQVPLGGCPGVPMGGTSYEDSATEGTWTSKPIRVDGQMNSPVIKGCIGSSIPVS
jgi:hypothetical protein